MADLTINYQREMYVDFTMPFLDLGKKNFCNEFELKVVSANECV